MASGKTLQSTIEISGVLSPSLQKAMDKAVGELADLADETLESADAATRLVAEMSAQEDVLKTLQRAYAGYVASGEKSSEEAKELAKKIQDVSGELRENKQTLAAAERAAQKLGGELDDLEDDAENAGDGFTVMKGALANLVADGIGAAVEGFKELAGASMEAYQTYDEGADTIIAKTGATGEAAAGLQAVYKNVSKSVTGEFSDIGTAVGEINTRFGLTGQDLEDLSVKFLKFAELNGTDVNGAIDSTQKALAAFGLDAGDAGGLLDTLNKVGQDTGVSMDTLSDLLLENASSFSQMGLDVHQSAALLGDIEKSGVTVEATMQALSKASQYAAEEGKPLSDVLEKTTEQMKNAKTDTEGLQVAYDVFGKKAGAKIYEAVKNGTLNLAELDKAMQNNAGSVENTYEATQDGMDKVALAVQGAKATVGDALAGFFDDHKDDIVKAIEDITNRIKSAIGWLTENVPKIVKWCDHNLPTIAIALGGIAAAMVAFKWSSIVGGVQKAIGAFKAFGAVLAANPIGLIIIGITALVAGFKYLWDNCEGFRNFWINLWEKIKEGVSVAVDWIGDCWEKIKAFFSGDSPIAQYFQMAWENIKIIWDVVVSYFQTIWENIKLAFSAVKSVFSGDFSGAWEAVKQIFANWGEFFSGLWDKAKQIFANVGEFFGSIFSKAWEKIKNVFAPVGEFFSGIWETIKNVVQVGIMAIKSIISAAFQLITLPFRFIWENCKGIIISVWNAIKEKVAGAVTAIVNFVKQRWENLKNNVLTVFNAVKTIIANVWNAIKGVIEPIITAIVNFVKQRWENLKNNVLTVFNAVKTIATNVWNGIKTSISNVVNGIQNTVSTIFDSIKSKVSGVFNGIKSIASSVWNGIKSAITTPINAARDAVKAAIDRIKGFFNFKWSLPKLKLPHFSIKGEFSLSPPSVPKLSIDWYKDGGILTQPTIFGSAGNKLLAGGEAGAEAVLPLAVLWDKMESILRNVFNGSSTGEAPDGGFTATAGKLLTLDDFSLGSLANNTDVVIYYDFSGFTWSPHIETNGSDDEDSFMARLKAHEAEFFDWLEEFIKMREVAQYA